MDKTESMKRDLCKIIKDFVSDIELTFPEYSANIDPRLKVLCNEYSVVTEYEEARDWISNYCNEMYPKNFFDILYKKESIFESKAEYLPGLDFNLLWNSDISDKTKDTIWKYLQLILFTITVNMNDKDSFGDTANLFEAIDENEFKAKLEETMAEMQNIFDTSGGGTFDEDISNIGLENMPDPTEIHDHINGMLNGKLGNLAKEIAEETAGDLNMNMEDATSMNDVFQRLFKNPGKLMDLVKNVGDKLDAKIKSGDIKESELIAEASEMMNKMKDMPGMGGMQEMLNKMAGGKVNMAGMQSKMAQNMRKATQKERMLNKLNANRAAAAATGPGSGPSNAGPSSIGGTLSEGTTGNKVYNMGAAQERTPINATAPGGGNKKKRRKNKGRK